MHLWSHRSCTWSLPCQQESPSSDRRTLLHGATIYKMLGSAAHYCRVVQCTSFDISPRSNELSEDAEQQKHDPSFVERSAKFIIGSIRLSKPRRQLILSLTTTDAASPACLHQNSDCLTKRGATQAWLKGTSKHLPSRKPTLAGNLSDSPWSIEAS